VSAGLDKAFQQIQNDLVLLADFVGAFLQAMIMMLLQLLQAKLVLPLSMM
jgi:hypothetical protein